MIGFNTVEDVLLQKTGGKGQKSKVLSLKLCNGESTILDWEEGLKMVVSYFEKRA
ncbi:hypothetical protein KIH41_02200 [Litoribacter ruber]|uniref:hypothetical protein n=1 Tax=Litoribacter ruber TaxID=702568 RepID=UPI001BD9A135|nr:hypothetical protein [Litoribacter ruber]MBT0810091.1 hypothetical protein [Litoribacter ruber]